MPRAIAIRSAIVLACVAALGCGPVMPGAHADGRGVEKSAAEAVRWLREAGKRGHERARERLRTLDPAPR